MRVAVIDTETTGLGPLDQVVELAVVMLEQRQRGGWEVVERWSSLVRPTVPVSLEARATHHILDAELADAPTMSELRIARRLRDADVIAAHNYQFDERLLHQSGVRDDELPERRVCTYRCAAGLFPDSPRHTNQVLRYYLGLEIPLLDLPPHRALSDAIVTSELLRRMLTETTIEDLVERTGAPVILKKVPMGRYEGRLWSDMDDGFLNWVVSRQFSDEIKDTARYWLRKRREVRP